MRVLTIRPIKVVQLLLPNADLSVDYGRSIKYRGEILLSCGWMSQEQIEQYIKIYDHRTMDQNPVDWAISYPLLKSIFAKAYLDEIVKRENRYHYQLSRLEMLDQPIKFWAKPHFLWYYDLEKRKKIRNYPPSDENIGHFYRLCQSIDEGNGVPSDNPARFLLDDEPRARALRKGILKRINWEWRVTRSPDWKKTFEKRFGRKYVENHTS